MIIKRNYFTTYLENHITKEQNRVLQSVPGFRVKYITMISILTEMMERDYNDFLPETFKEYYKEKYRTRYFNFSVQFNNFPSEWVYNYTSIINESFFDFIKTNDYADFYNLEYLVKTIENILKIAKFKIDDF